MRPARWFHTGVSTGPWASGAARVATLLGRLPQAAPLRPEPQPGAAGNTPPHRRAAGALASATRSRHLPSAPAQFKQFPGNLLRLADSHSQARGDDRFGGSHGRLLRVTPGRAFLESLVTMGPRGVATPGAARRWDRPTTPAWREGTLLALRPSTGPWPPERGAADCSRRIRADRSAVCRPSG
jgi:hypothetical protein